MRVTGKMLLLMMGFAMSLGLYGQTSREVTVLDQVTHRPVARASIYTKHQGRFLSTMTDENGMAKIAFRFDHLSVSHLNYQKRRLGHLPDTIYLKPIYQTTVEVVVTNKEPEWIRRKLKQVVKEKEAHYFQRDVADHFEYNTQSLGTNSLYRYRLTGLLRSKSDVHKRYAFSQDSAFIVSPDSTRLTDTQNLRRMLYEDFMLSLDNGFIRSHRFSENPNFHGRSASEIELRFRAKDSNDDRGSLVIDTTRCIILQATRLTGTKTNKRELTDAFFLAAAKLFGYHIDKWTRDYRVVYGERSDGTMYPLEVRYKFFLQGRDGSYDKRQADFDEQTGGGFPNMEATLKLTPTAPDADENKTWEELPPSWYIQYNSDADRQREVELSNLPALFTLYEEE